MTPRTQANVPRGFSFTLTGLGFQPDADVFFGNSPSPEVVVLSGASIQAKAPAVTQTGSVNITVFNPDGTQGTKLAAFTYVSTQAATHAEVLGVSPLSVIEDTETEGIVNGRYLIDAYNNRVLTLRTPGRASVEVLATMSSHDANTGIDTFVFTVRIVATPQLARSNAWPSRWSQAAGRTQRQTASSRAANRCSRSCRARGRRRSHTALT